MKYPYYQLIKIWVVKVRYGPVLILLIVGLYIALGNVFGNGNLANDPMTDHGAKQRQQDVVASLRFD